MLVALVVAHVLSKLTIFDGSNESIDENQRVKKRVKSSKFNLYIPVNGHADQFLVYNTLNDSCAAVEKGVVDHLRRGSLNGGPEGEAGSFWKALSPLGVVIDDSMDEDREVEYWFQRLKFNNSTLRLTVVVTELCNLACRYCYERDRQGSAKMDEATSERLIQWIGQHVESMGAKKIYIDFYGGEPLLNMKTIVSISAQVSRLAKAQGIDFGIGIITNGTLLSSDLIDCLAPLGLREVKVTLDGDEANHDRLRPDHNGFGTFRRIFDNLCSIRGMVPIRIGGNLDDRAIGSVPALLDEIEEAGLRESICSIQFKPIFASESDRSGTESFNACKFDDCPNLDAFLDLHRLIVERGFPTDARISLGPCEACSEGNFAVGPCGELYKCAVMAGQNDAVIGTIDRDDLNHWNTRFMTLDLWHRSECRDCAFLPICGGGCRYTARVEGGSWEGASCNRRYFEEVSVPMIRDLYGPKGGETS